MTVITKVIDGVVFAARGVAGTALIALMLLFCVDVVSRYFFGRPIAGVFEITTTLLLPLVVFIGMCVSIPSRTHVRLGVVYDRLRGPARRAIHVASLLAGAGFWGAVTYAVGSRSAAAFAGNQVSTVSFALPIAWGYGVVALGAGLMTLVSLLSTLLPEPEVESEDSATPTVAEGV